MFEGGIVKLMQAEFSQLVITHDAAELLDELLDFVLRQVVLGTSEKAVSTRNYQPSPETILGFIKTNNVLPPNSQLLERAITSGNKIVELCRDELPVKKDTKDGILLKQNRWSRMPSQSIVQAELEAYKMVSTSFSRRFTFKHSCEQILTLKQLRWRREGAVED